MEVAGVTSADAGDSGTEGVVGFADATRTSFVSDGRRSGSCSIWSMGLCNFSRISDDTIGRTVRDCSGVGIAFAEDELGEVSGTRRSWSLVLSFCAAGSVLYRSGRRRVVAEDGVGRSPNWGTSGGNSICFRTSFTSLSGAFFTDASLGGIGAAVTGATRGAVTLGADGATRGGRGAGIGTTCGAILAGSGRTGVGTGMGAGGGTARAGGEG